ncbi:hypothetical protein KEM54_000866 [Ascosphaera aggregata]|nr:hypothetical protein KEM54_000866 [Ascosphaera aggregata]
MDRELDKDLKRLLGGDNDALIPVIRGFLFKPGADSDFENMASDTRDASKLLKLPETDVEHLVQELVNQKK